jgi:hypothetical protein
MREHKMALTITIATGYSYFISSKQTHKQTSAESAEGEKQWHK